MTISSAVESTVSPSLNAAGLRILIAEDHADCALSLAILLPMHGHEVEMAANGPSALEKARTDNPDVVLLDIGLPGMSGYEVSRQLTAHRPRKTPLLIAVTGFGQEEDRRNSAESGIDLHLLKPIDTDELRALLKRFHQFLAQ